MNGITDVNRNVRIVLVTVVVLFLAACAAVSSDNSSSIKPFDAFTASLVELQKGTDQAISQLQPKAQDRFRRDVLAELQDPDDLEKPRTISLEIKLDDRSPFGLVDVPYFLKIPQFRNGAHNATGALIDYSRLLSQLANPDLVPPETFNKMTATTQPPLSYAITPTGIQAQLNRGVAYVE